MSWSEFYRNPLVFNTVAGAVAGLVAALRVDYMAFKAFKSVDEIAKYDYKTAARRAFEGFVLGAIAGFTIPQFN